MTSRTRAILTQLYEPSAELIRAVRRLRRNPAYTSLVLSTATIGMAPLLAVTFLLMSYIHTANGVEAPSSLRRLYQVHGIRSDASSSRGLSVRIPFLLFQSLAATPRYARRVAAYVEATVLVSRSTTSTSARTAIVSNGYFQIINPKERPVLGIFPSMGANQRSAVLSRAFWKEAFGAETSIIGSEILIGGHSYRVAAVAGETLRGFDDEPTEVWLPLAEAPEGSIPGDFYTNWLSPNTNVLLRLLPGETERSLERELTGQGTGGSDILETELRLAPLNPHAGPLFQRERAQFHLMLVAAGAIWVAALFNLSNAVLVRGLEQSQVIGIQLALGASWARILTGLLCEAGLLGLMASVLAGTLAFAVLRPLSQTLSPLFRWDVHIIHAGAMLSVLAGLVISVGLCVSAVIGLTQRRDQHRLLFAGPATHVPSRVRVKLVLVTLQIAIATVACLVALGASHSYSRVQAIKTGIDLEQVYIADIRARRFGGTLGEEQTLESSLTTNRPRVYGARSVALSSSKPFSFSNAWWFTLPSGATSPLSSTYVTRISENYFSTIGQRVLAGRSFAATEDAGMSTAVIVNTTLARTVWPMEDPIGKCIHLGGPERPCLQIVGVVTDARREMLIESPEPHAYVPLSSSLPNLPIIALIGRAPDARTSLVSQMRGVIANAGGHFAVTRVFRLSSLVEPQVIPWKRTALILGSFAITGLLVMSSGIYATAAYLMETRRREAAIRFAVGGLLREVVLSLLRPVLLAAAVGTMVGVMATAAASTVLQPLLYDARIFDVSSVLVLMAAIGAALALAATEPVRRARRMDIRSELAL